MVDFAKVFGPRMCQICHQRPATMRKRTLCKTCYLKAWIDSNPMCLVAGCKKHSYAKGICRCHYAQKVSGRPFTLPRHGNAQELDALEMLEFQRERIEYQLRLERDAYRCSVTVEARLSHRYEVERLEVLKYQMKGGSHDNARVEHDAGPAGYVEAGKGREADLRGLTSRATRL
jgi:hypothetical protein